MISTFVKTSFDVPTNVVKIIHEPDDLPIPKELGSPIHLDITSEELPNTLNIYALPGSGLIYTSSNFDACPLSEISIDTSSDVNFEGVTELLFEFVATSGVSRIGNLRLFGKPVLDIDAAQAFDLLPGNSINYTAQELIDNSSEFGDLLIQESELLNSNYLNVIDVLDSIDFGNNLLSATGFYVGILMQANPAYNPAGTNIGIPIFVSLNDASNGDTTFRVDLNDIGEYTRYQVNNVSYLNETVDTNILTGGIPKPLPVYEWHFYEFNYDKISNIMYVYVDGALHDVLDNITPEITDPITRLRINTAFPGGTYKKIARFLGLNRFASQTDRESALKVVDNVDGFDILRSRSSEELGSPVYLGSGQDKPSYATFSTFALTDPLTTTELTNLNNILSRFKDLLNSQNASIIDSELGELSNSEDLVLWFLAGRGIKYSGEGNSVSLWVDYSREKNHATDFTFVEGQNRDLPTAEQDGSGRSFISFNKPSNGYLFGRSLVPTDRGKRTIFVVSKDNPVSRLDNVHITFGADVDNTLVTNVFDTELILQEENLQNGDIRVLTNKDSNTTITADITEPFYQDQRHVSCWAIDNKALTFYVDGQQKSITSLTNPLIGDSLNGYSIGNIALNSCNGIYEILVYAKLLNNLEITEISNKLLSRSPDQENTFNTNVPLTSGFTLFRGPNAYVQIDVADSIPNFTNWGNGDWSASFWFYNENISGVADMVGIANSTGSNDALRIFLSSNNVGVRVRATNNSTMDIYTGAVVSFQTWYLFTVTRSGDTFTVYLNDTELNTLDFGSAFENLVNVGTHWVFGKIPDTNNFTSHFIEGRLSDFRFWNITLTNEEITRLYNQGLQEIPQPQQENDAYYRLNDFFFLNETGRLDDGVIRGFGAYPLLPEDSDRNTAKNLLSYTPAELPGITYVYTFGSTINSLNNDAFTGGLSNGVLYSRTSSSQPSLDFSVTFASPVYLNEIDVRNGQTNSLSGNAVQAFRIYADAEYTTLLAEVGLTAPNNSDPNLTDLLIFPGLNEARSVYYISCIRSSGSTLSIRELDFYGAIA